MFDHLKSHLHTLRASPPGERFRCYHEARRGDARPLQRALLVVAGLLVIAVGIVMLPAPGPGMLVVLAGSCILAGESKRVAQGLDRAELAARRLWQRLRGDKTPSDAASS
jgi:uncharacterized protein (TIGR02611 family)